MGSQPADLRRHLTAGSGGLSIPHGVGTVWATAVWEMYWNLVDDHGFDPDLYNGTGGNNIAIQLVVDGLKLQGCNPTFLDARDAILAADVANNGGANECLIWSAFAKRGMGVNAQDGGSARTASTSPRTSTCRRSASPAAATASARRRGLRHAVPSDCVGGTSSGAVCGNGVCEAGNGEDCVSCAADCNGKTGGKPSNRFCCGDGDGPNPVSCSDSRCTDRWLRLHRRSGRRRLVLLRRSRLRRGRDLLQLRSRLHHRRRGLHRRRRRGLRRRRRLQRRRVQRRSELPGAGLLAVRQQEHLQRRDGLSLEQPHQDLRGAVDAASVAVSRGAARPPFFLSGSRQGVRRLVLALNNRPAARNR